MQATGKIFNRQLLYHRLKKIAATFSEHDFLHQYAAKKITENIDITQPKTNKVLIFGQKSEHIAEHISSKNPQSDIITCSLNRIMLPSCEQSNINMLVADEEDFPFSGKFDLIISSLNIQFINDVPSYLLKVRSCLNEGGFFIANFFGENSLMELRDSFARVELALYGKAYLRIIPFITREAIAVLARKAGFRDNITTMDSCEASYPCIVNLLKDLKHAGLGNIMYNTYDNHMGKYLLPALNSYYHANHQDDEGKIIAHFDIISLIASV